MSAPYLSIPCVYLCLYGPPNEIYFCPIISTNKSQFSSPPNVLFYDVVLSAGCDPVRLTGRGIIQVLTGCLSVASGECMDQLHPVAGHGGGGGLLALPSGEATLRVQTRAARAG